MKPSINSAFDNAAENYVLQLHRMSVAIKRGDFARARELKGSLPMFFKAFKAESERTEARLDNALREISRARRW